VADYSEFPTTPTAWQEVDQFETAPPEASATPPRRAVDPVALVPGVRFIVLAVVVLAGAHIPPLLFEHGGVLWVLLIVGGAALLVRELRRSRRR
jgi:hypothetical protein